MIFQQVPSRPLDRHPSTHQLKHFQISRLRVISTTPQGHEQEEFQLRFGLLNIYEPDQKRGIEYIETNPNYNKNNLDHDLAIVKLDKPIEFNDNVMPAVLPCDTSPP